jgi:hypothetical protein
MDDEVFLTKIRAFAVSPEKTRPIKMVDEI